MKAEYISHMGDDLFVANCELEPAFSWAAGILEGEGCFSIHTRRSTGNKALAIHCEMTDRDVIYRLKEVLGVGSICYRENDNRKDNKVRKPSWILSVQKQKDIFDTLLRISPFMHERRSSKMAEMYQYLEEKFIQ